MDEKIIDITKLKTVANVSHDKRVSVPTVWNMIKRGDIKAVKIDGITFCVNED